MPGRIRRPEAATAQFAAVLRVGVVTWIPKGGHWEVLDGAFKGTENPEMHHPATASIGFDFKDVVITCEVRMHDVPLDSRTNRFFRHPHHADAKDYVCSIFLNESGMRIQKDDNNDPTEARMSPCR